MNMQNNDDVSVNEEKLNNRLSSDTEECIKLEGERAPVKKDAKTVNDDANDYLFLKSYKKVRRVTKDEIRNENGSGENFTIVKSSHSSARHSRKKTPSHKSGKKMKTWKKVALGVLCTLLSLTVLIAGSIALLINKGSSELLSESYIVTAPDGVETQDGGDYVVYNGHTYQLNKKVTSILCMGIDKRDLGKTSTGTGGGQADAIILIAVDTSNGNTTMINISRDTMTDVSVYSAGGSFVDTETMQICLSYAYGDGEESSCENTVSSVQRLFYNIPINSYMSLDLDGISAINDSIGGVDVVSPETIGDFVQGETYHLEGDLTEAFVRTRDTSQLDSNNGRMQRQQTYLSAFISNFVEQTKEDISTPLSLYNTASPYVCTNINSSRVVYLAQNIVLNGGLSTDIKTIPGTVEEGEEYAEFYVDETEFYEMFLSIYYTQIS